ncbi:MAG TPA: hypothetical protein VNW30_07065 [Opitutaceae bacterium]|jgi:hypothetical protein|nr:hypothetical protein [Opitutaceae bacterium]
MTVWVKVFFSLFAMYAPFMAVYFWAGRRFKKARLKYYGYGFVATGVTTCIGAKYFGLAIAGRYWTGAVAGEAAVSVALLVLTAGVVMIAIHYIAFVWIPAARHARSSEGKKTHKIPSMSIAGDKLWGPVDMKHWKTTPCVSGRLATEQDVREERATFYLSGDRSELKPILIPLPACAIHHEEKEKRATPVILIQAEETPKIKTVGFRYLGGGNGVCTLAELEILKEPDGRFK